jgi:hypothetical protein
LGCRHSNYHLLGFPSLPISSQLMQIDIPDKAISLPCYRLPLHLCGVGRSMTSLTQVLSGPSPPNKCDCLLFTSMHPAILYHPSTLPPSPFSGSEQETQLPPKPKASSWTKSSQLPIGFQKLRGSPSRPVKVREKTRQRWEPISHWGELALPYMSQKYLRLQTALVRFP